MSDLFPLDTTRLEKFTDRDFNEEYRIYKDNVKCLKQDLKEAKQKYNAVLKSWTGFRENGCYDTLARSIFLENLVSEVDRVYRTTGKRHFIDKLPFVLNNTDKEVLREKLDVMFGQEQYTYTVRSLPYDEKLIVHLA